ncbi:MAG: DNA cytosine methyltransferase [Nitrosopumilaceae archaeon]|nr:DNA cytosine methyltransferase [Nitrosopumilaceae archaeon]
MGRGKRSAARDVIRQIVGGPYRDNLYQRLDAAYTGLLACDPGAEPFSNPPSAPIKIVDMFCGCGGASAGFLAVNRALPVFEVVSAWDVDRDACSTYAQLGFEPTCDDVRTVLKDRKKMNDLKRRIADGPASILIGCPPCQGFSAHTKVHLDAVEDRRNRLVKSFSLISAELEPDYVFMENVPELLSSKYRKHFKFFRGKMESKGYRVASGVVNMAEFGLPQTRKRAIVLASRNPIATPRPIMAGENLVTVRRAISHLPKIRAGAKNPDDPFHVTANHRKTTLDTIRAVPKDGGSRRPGLGPECLDRVRGFSDVYGRMRWDRPSVTITGSARNPASGRYVHPDQNRGLSAREALTLQGFPVAFSLNGSFCKKFELVGNAVPPLFAAAVAAHLIIEMAELPEMGPERPGPGRFSGGRRYEALELPENALKNVPVKGRHGQKTLGS